MPAETACRIFRFGAFEVSEASGELRKHGVRIKLHAQPFQVLILLLERPSEMISREEIRTRLWSDGTFVDFDHGLNTAVNKLRQALSDSAADPRYVETVAGKGYRFIAPVTPSAPELPTIEPPDLRRTQIAGVLATVDELPGASRKLVRTLFLLMQAMYLAFYVGALANLPEIRDILDESKLPAPTALFSLLVLTAVGLIPLRLFLIAAISFDSQQLHAKFGRLFPALLPLDLLWALSPLLLINHFEIGVALGMIAALLYVPFAQRSLVLMYARGV